MVFNRESWRCRTIAPAMVVAIDKLSGGSRGQAHFLAPVSDADERMVASGL